MSTRRISAMARSLRGATCAWTDNQVRATCWLKSDLPVLCDMFFATHVRYTRPSPLELAASIAPSQDVVPSLDFCAHLCRAGNDRAHAAKNELKRSGSGRCNWGRPGDEMIFDDIAQGDPAYDSCGVSPSLSIPWTSRHLISFARLAWPLKSPIYAGHRWIQSFCPFV